MTMARKNTQSDMVTLSNNGRAFHVRLASCAVCGKDYFQLNGHQKYCSDECLHKAHGKSEENNAGLPQVGCEVHRHLYRSNFQNDSERRERMAILRKQGKTNAEVAKAVGCSYGVVLKILGPQPGFITATSKRVAGMKRSLVTQGIKKNELVYEQAKKYEQIHNDAGAIAREIERLQVRLEEVKSKGKMYEKGYVTANSLEKVATKVCPSCGRIFRATHHMTVYCADCSSHRKEVNAYIANHVRRKSKYDGKTL